MNMQNDKQFECCPPFDPQPWDDKVFTWENKNFITGKVRTLFYMPLNFGGEMTRLHKLVTDAGAVVPDWLCLSEHTSKWNQNLYLAVDKRIKNAENTTRSGKFFSKVYEGSFSDTGKWIKDFESISKSKGYKIQKQYFWYTTCPKCAKKFGKNYVVIIAAID